MANYENVTEVFAWDKKIATLLDTAGKLYFQPTDEATLAFSPLKLTTLTTQSYHDLPFQYQLPGLISDHIPGSYGMSYMDAFFRKEQARLPSILERLQFIGQHSIGALEFVPATHTGITGELLELKEMYTMSKQALKGEHDFALATLIAVSNSAGGGARAKAHIGYNHTTQKIYVTDKHAALPEGFSHAIVKFDEYKEQGNAFIPELYTSRSAFTKTEYIYSLMAKRLGINMADTFLIEDATGSHFITHRFDQKDGQRQHLHSLSGLLHHDSSQQFSLGYEHLFRTGLALNVPHSAMEQIFKTMIFNLVFGNRDDHSKNFSFMMNTKGEWDFSPSYDLTYVINKGAGSEHQLSIDNNPATWVTYKVLEVIGKTFGVREYKKIISDTIEAKQTMLRSLGKEYDLPKDWIDAIFENTKQIDKQIITE